MSDTQTLTPLMQQYFEIKQQHPDAVLLFQVGDFYEMFFDDAKQAAAFLGAAIVMGVGSIGPALGQGMIGKAACDAVGKNPERISTVLPADPETKPRHRSFRN